MRIEVKFRGQTVLANDVWYLVLQLLRSGHPRMQPSAKSLDEMKIFVDGQEQERPDWMDLDA